MNLFNQQWNYLIVTASNENQAKAYTTLLNVRKDLGLLTGVQEVLVVPDYQGKRIGSGGSTLLCLTEVLNREIPKHQADPAKASDWLAILSRLRILIIHAGGDSKRLPAYGPCGKLFVPVPGETDTAVGTTLFDRQLPIYLALACPDPERGQVVITSGDVLVNFDPREVRFASTGITGLGCYATPKQATNHGVFCVDPEGRVRLFLQKPSLDEQAKHQAINRYGQTVLDIGVMNFDADTAVKLLRAGGIASGPHQQLTWAGSAGQAVVDLGLDFYREICCALGLQATPQHHFHSAQTSGSKWDKPLLNGIFDALAKIPFSAQVLYHCDFLDFGTSRQILKSGNELLRRDRGISHPESCLDINNSFTDTGAIVGVHAWAEGCVIKQPLTLEGDNVIVGADIFEPLALEPKTCLDILPGFDRNGKSVWFVRLYGIEDTFKETLDQSAAFFGRPVLEWINAVGANPADIWDPSIPESQRSVWDARLFPATGSSTGFRDWLWMADPARANDRQRQTWLNADRYSLAEMAGLSDLKTFHQRRSEIHGRQIRKSLRRLFHVKSGFSARDLACVLALEKDRTGLVAELLSEADWYFGNGTNGGLETFVFSRIIHTLASALELLADPEDPPLAHLLPDLGRRIASREQNRLDTLGLIPEDNFTVRQWTQRARSAAFENFGRAIVSSDHKKPAPPASVLRSDEIVWGRDAARLDIGGGWTDTPPYALEFGGCVCNAAVNLNGQPPIQAYARIISEPVIRITSIDVGSRIQISELEDLHNFQNATDTFGLAKAALVLSGLSPTTAAWPENIRLCDLLKRFGGGIELTTLAAIPKGSGLGTSSIIGAVILSVVQRIMGQTLTHKELFHGVLRLEQALTTGGGWQDQVGGAVEGVKIASTTPGLIPDPRIHYVPSDVLDPHTNNGRTILYYTGITRLAKNILRQVVGSYLDRDRTAMATLNQLHRIASTVADALARKDLPAFGKLIDQVWQLNKQLDPDSTNPEIERLLARVRPYLHGAKLLGAGGGGFLLMICKSDQDALAVKQLLQQDPPNDRDRFFDFNISKEGLIVTVC